MGAVMALGLARQGHAVTVVDRDPGPAADGSWAREGVMQFKLAHGFRPQVVQLLSELMPDVLATVVEHGAVPVQVPGVPFQAQALCARRETVERGLRAALAREPGVIQRRGHADDVAVVDGQLRGLVVDGVLLEADLVVVATGRASRLGHDHRRPAQTVPCGMAYINRMYQAVPGVEVPLTPIPRGANADSYLTMVHTYEDNIVSVLLVRPTADKTLAELRHPTVFDAVVPSIPSLAPYLDRDRFQPITEVMAGAGLHNSYQSVLNLDGTPVPGLLYVGDAVLTTNPQAGRGVTTGLLQVRELLRLLAQTRELTPVAIAFDGWCETNLRPWFDDHLYWDQTLLARWAGKDIDVDAPIASDVVCAAAAVDPDIASAAGPFLGMFTNPHALDPYRERVRALLKTGWRPVNDPGPTARQLADHIARQRVG